MRKLIPFFLTLVAAVLLGTSTGCTAKAKKVYHMQRADKFFASSQFAKAEIEYLNVLRFDAVNSHAIGRLGAIYYDQGRFGRAFPCLSKACELSPDDLDLLSKLATIHLAAGKAKEAHAEASHILDKMPAHAEGPTLLAESISSRKEAEEVRGRLEKLMPQGTNTAPIQLGLGALALRLGDAQAAEAAFRSALTFDPKSSAAHYALGNLLWRQNDLKGAEAELKLAAELSERRSARRLSYAEFKIRTGSLEEGKGLLQEIVKQTPDYLPAWIRQAEIALAATNFAECTSLLNQALARDSANYEALLLEGRSLLAQGEGAKAVAKLERLSSLYERSAQVHYQLALAYLLNKDVNKAFKSLTQATTLEKNFPEAILLLAQLNIRKGDPDAAIAPLTELIKQRPQIHQAHLLLASAYMAGKKPDLDAAAAVYQRMLTLFPKSPQVPLLLGTVLAQQNKHTEARKAFEKSLELAPDFLLAVEQLVDVDLAEKQFAPALERVKKEVEKRLGAPEPLLLLAKVHIAQATEFARQQQSKAGPVTEWSEVPAARESISQAETALLKVIELAPGQSTAYTMLAQLYVRSGKHQQALDRLNSLAGSTNLASQASALTQIGMIQDELKNRPAARDAYEKLLTVNSNSWLALNNLAYLYCEHLGDLNKAYEMADRARRLLPASPYTADTLGWVLYKRGEYSRALGLVQESAGSLPNEPEVHFHLGMIHYMLGDEGPARVALQQSLQASKEFPGKEEGNRRLALLTNDSKAGDPAALADLEKRVRDEPNDPIATARLAAIYEQQGAVEKAVVLYETALKQNPRNGRLMGRLAQIYATRSADKRRAFELAKDAHSLAPDDPSVTWTLGRLVSSERDYQWALSLLQDAGRKMPETPGLLYDLSWAYYNLGQVEEAESTMQSAVQSGSSFPEAQDAKQFLAFVAAAKSTAAAQKAVAQAQQVLGANSNYVPALMIVAIVREEQAKFEEAKSLYETILTSNPLFVAAARKLAILCANHFSDDPKAYDLAVKSRAAFPQDKEVARSLGILAYRHGDYSRAAELLKEALQNEDGEQLYYLGMTHYKLKQTKESKDALQRALAMNIQPRFADDAKRVLTELK